MGSLCNKMDKRSIFLILALAITSSARPKKSAADNIAEANDYDYYDDPEPCSAYFKNATDIFTEVGISQQDREKQLTFDCIDEKLCKDQLIHDKTYADFHGSSILKVFRKAAADASCPEENQVCCQVKQSVENELNKSTTK